MVKKYVVMACLVWLGAQSASNAALVQFTDKSAFLAATGAVSATGALPDSGYVGTSEIVGNVTISSPLGIYIGGSVDWTTRLPGEEIAINGVENLDVSLNLGGPTYAFGFDFVEPQFDPNVNAPFFESTFQVKLFQDATEVGSFNFEAPNDVASFIGAWGDVAFNNVQIREIVGDIDNEFFGEFYTGRTALPEPSMFLTFAGLAGFGMLFGWRKCRRSNTLPN